MNKVTNIIMAGLMLVTSVAAFADPDVQKIPDHPRVNEVNGRRENQHDRIQQGVKNGSINKHELNQLHREGHAIHTEERAMRRADHGHLTKTDQRVLNRQQNARSRQIFRDKHNGK